MSAPAPVRRRAGTWTVSDSRTRIAFSVGSLGRRVHGTVPLLHGALELDGNGVPVHAHGVVDLDGLDTGIARRDADLRTPRFLDVDRHPLLTWDARRFARAGDGWTAVGELRVRDTAAPLDLVGAPDPDPDPDPAGDGWLHVRAHGVVDRAAVGIRGPALLVGRRVEVELDAWLAAPRR